MLENLPLARAGVDRDAVTRASAEDLARLRGHPDARWLLARPDGVAATGAALDLHPMTALGDLGWRDLRPALDIARSRWTELTALESEIADLGERLETRKAVDRAKGVLMSQLKLSEADAFRWIQKTAMDRRLGMREVAEAVITGLPSKR